MESLSSFRSDIRASADFVLIEISAGRCTACYRSHTHHLPARKRGAFNIAIIIRKCPSIVVLRLPHQIPHDLAVAKIREGAM
jgi:hypothetical protein